MCLCTAPIPPQSDSRLDCCSFFAFPPLSLPFDLPRLLDSTCLGSACDPGLDNKILIRIGKQLAFVSNPSIQTSSAFHCPGSINKQNPIQQTFALDAARNHGRFNNSALTRVTSRPHLIETRRAQACINMRFRWIPGPFRPHLVWRGHFGTFRLPNFHCVYPYFLPALRNTFTKPGGEVSFTIPFQRRLRR